MAEIAEFVKRLQRASRAIAEVDADADAGDDASPAAVARVLEQHLPELLASIRLDRAAGAFAHWGLSTVVDENLRAPVIGRPLFEALHEAAGLRAEWPVGNAGVLHVYGYLLSSVETPYGLKRERWVGSELTAVLGMPAGAFVAALLGAGPGRRGGGAAATIGLLTYVTEAVTAAIEPSTTAAITAAVVDEFAGEEREEVLRAVYLAGVHEATGSPTPGGAVVYLELLGDTTRIVTVFPVRSSASEWLEGFTSEPPRLRYNAAAHELPARSPLAKRLIRLPR